MKPVPSHVRWLVRRDIPQVLEIEQLGFSRPWSKEEFLGVLRCRNCIGMSACHPTNGEVFGFVIYELFPKRIQILNLAVHPSIWRRGVGRSLVSMVKTKLAPGKRERILTDVTECNVRGQLFWKGVGFQSIATLANYYCDDSAAYMFSYVLPAKVAA